MPAIPHLIRTAENGNKWRSRQQSCRLYSVFFLEIAVILIANDLSSYDY